MSAVPLNDSPMARRISGNIDSSVVGSETPRPERRPMGRTTSGSSTQVDPTAPSRSGTLRKNPSLRKRASLSRRASRRSLRAGSMRGMGNDEDEEAFNNVFHTPIPTRGNPTEVLADRFQAWRRLLKDLITYFREIQTSYEHRAKALMKVSNVINNTQPPSMFLSQGGLNDAISTLKGFHKISLTESNKSKDIEDDVITQLNGLRSDLNQKIKEIKSLSGDFKNSVDKESDTTRKAVDHLKDALASAENDSAAAAGKNDPYIIRLAVDRQVEKQIEEENYLHRAYLNLEGSGRELESIVVGEIQKAYNAYVGILRREAEHAHEAIDELRGGPIAMPKDQEWMNFVENDQHFVNPNIPLRRLDDIYYPGKFEPAAAEIRASMLERKSKYLKSYTPGWYVLSPTHLHEFKSADRIQSQQPVMSLYLLDQKLGSRSQDGASSNKFSLKGRQTGAMHRGHSWVFRAESYDTMMAWYDDIKNLTEKTGAARTAFVRQHARSVSGASNRVPSISSDGMAEDEADTQPYAANATAMRQETLTPPPKRPSPGGRFPSDVNLQRNLTAPLSPSRSSNEPRGDTVMIASAPQHDQQAMQRDQPGVVERRDHSVAALPVVAQPVVAPPADEPLTVQQGAYRTPAAATSMQRSAGFPDHPSTTLARERQAGQPVLDQPHKASNSPSELSAQPTPPTQSINHPFRRGGDPNAVHDSPVAGAGAHGASQHRQNSRDAGLQHGLESTRQPLDQALDSGLGIDSARDRRSRDLATDKPLQAQFPEPTGMYRNRSNGYERSQQAPEIISGQYMAPTPAEAPPEEREPTLPDLSSAAFAGAGAQAVTAPSETHAADPAGQVFNPAHAGTVFAPSKAQTDASSLATTTASLTEDPSDMRSSSTMVEPDMSSNDRGFPRRHDTSTSISQLHVPGEFPSTPAELA